MFRRGLIRKLLDHYADAADYDGPIFLTLSYRRYVEAARRLGYADLAMPNDFGGTLVQSRLVWINSTGHRTVAELADTCAHEAWHLASGVVADTPTFLAGVRMLVLGKDP